MSDGDLYVLFTRIEKHSFLNLRPGKKGNFFAVFFFFVVKPSPFSRHLRTRNRGVESHLGINYTREVPHKGVGYRVHPRISQKMKSSRGHKCTYRVRAIWPDFCLGREIFFEVTLLIRGNSFLKKTYFEECWSYFEGDESLILLVRVMQV